MDKLGSVWCLSRSTCADESQEQFANPEYASYIKHVLEHAAQGTTHKNS